MTRMRSKMRVNKCTSNSRPRRIPGRHCYLPVRGPQRVHFETHRRDETSRVAEVPESMNRPFLAVWGVLGVVSAVEKPRIHITESGVTEITAENLSVRKGISSENIEVMKSFLKQCPDVTITGSRDKADYLV